MTVGSLFSGIGGFDLGLERAGMKVLWQVEIDPFCNKVLEKHWPNIKRYGDIRDIGKHNLSPVDLICGGFPCQPFSHAGKRKGTADDRYLWPEMLRVIQEVRPRWVLGENVAGIINMELDNVLSDLEGAGYETQAFVIPACAINAPHRRDRVWVVAYSKSTNGWWNPQRLGKQSRSEKEIFQEQSINRSTSADCHAALSSSNGFNSPKLRELPQDTGEAQTGKEISTENGRHQLLDAGKRNVADTTRGRWEQCLPERETERDIGKGNWNESWYEVATRLCRVDDGVPNRVDRLKCLGNAVVPQIVEILGRAIMETNGR